MKNKVEDLLQGVGSYNFENSIVLISGNEEGLAFKVQNIIFEKIKSSKSVEKIILDYKDLDKSTLREPFLVGVPTQIKIISDALTDFFKSVEKFNFLFL